MSSYITRYCLHHGEWDMDVDNPGDCEQCIQEGIDPLSKARRRIAALESALTTISKGRDSFGNKIPLEHLRRIATDAITGAAMEAPSTLETEVRHEIGGAGSPCPCKGHPFNCVNHPHDCGCQAKIKGDAT